MYYLCIPLLFPDCRISVSVVLWLVNNQVSRKATSLNPSLDNTHVELSCKESSFSIAGFRNHSRISITFLDYQKFMNLITPHQHGRHVKLPAPPLKLWLAQHAPALDPTCMFSQDTLDRSILTNCIPSTLWKLCGDYFVPAILQRDL